MLSEDLLGAFRPIFAFVFKPVIKKLLTTRFMQPPNDSVRPVNRLIIT